MRRNRPTEEGRGVRPPGWNEEEQYQHSNDEEYQPARKLLKNLLENEVDRAIHELDQEILPLTHLKGHRAASLIPEFDPDGEDCTVSTWIKKIDQLGDIHGWTDQIKAFHLQDKLRGQARKWYNRLDEYNYSWNEWKDMLIRAFPKHRDYSALLDEMMQRKKLPNETMTKYYQDKIAMCFRCNLSDAASVSCIIRGLPTPLQPNARAFQCQRPDDLYEAFLCALDDYRTPTIEPRAPNKDTKQLTMPDKKVNPDTDPCPRCKKTGHILRNCTIPDQRICFKCGVQGHIATRCNSASSTHIKAHVEPNSNVKEIKLLQNYNEIYKKVVKLNGIYLKSYIDTGSQVNVINSQIVSLLGLKMTPTSTMLKGFSGGILTSRGEVQFTLEIDNIKVQCTAHVTDTDMQDIHLLIGQPIINADRVSLMVMNGTTILRLEPEPSTEFSVAEEVQKFKVVTANKESLPPGTSIIKVQLQGNPEGNDVCTAPRHYELQGVSYSLPATLLRGREGYIKVINTGAENVNWRAGEVLTRAESCIEPESQPSQLITVDSRPVSVCYICYARLGNCVHLQEQVYQNEAVLTQIIHQNSSIPTPSQNTFKVIHPLLQWCSDSIAKGLDMVLNDQVKSEPTDMTQEGQVKKECVEGVSVPKKPKKAESKTNTQKINTSEVERVIRYKKKVKRLRKEKSITTGIRKNSNSDRPPNKCDICYKHFRYKSQLTYHMRSHTAEKPYICDKCGKCFTLWNNFKAHMYLHTGVKLHKCDICEKNFSFKNNLRKHVSTHTGEKPYQCDICNKSYRRKQYLTQHRLLHTVGKAFQCIVCEKAFSRKESLKLHLLTHSGEKSFKCNVCEKCFSQKTSLYAHIRIHTGENLHTCEICKKTFVEKHNLNIHMRVHTGERPYKCEVCGKCFIQQSKLRRHNRLHTGEKPYKCDICGKPFRSKENLNEHIRIHDAVKQYICDICGKSCSVKNNLKAHIRVTHAGEKPHKCSLCGKVFSSKGNLTKHMLVHTGEKPYKCDKCDKGFTRKFALNVHMRRHTEY